MTMTSNDVVQAALARLDDTPLRYDLRPVSDEDLGAVLGAAPAPKSQFLIVRSILVIQLIELHVTTGHWLHYSRDKNVYASLRRYFGNCFTHKAMMWAVESLEHCGLIEHERTLPGPNRRYRSRIRLKVPIDESLCNLDLVQHLHETIHLKDHQKRRIDYRNSREVCSWRKDTLEHNEAVGAIDIDTMNLAGVRRVGPRLIGNKWTANTMRVSLYRVFNECWRLGGRFYCGFWQNLPCEARELLRLDGADVISPERDHSCLHPRLLTAALGHEWDGGDFYDLENFTRGDTKDGFQIMLNCPSHKNMLTALAFKFSGAKAKEKTRLTAKHYARAKLFMQNMEIRHPKFTQCWGKGAGLRLQFWDSEMCARVMRQLRRKGIVVLPVHDSFVAAESALSLLEEAMDDAMHWGLHHLRKHGIRS